jgi:ubiquinone/menaquinone biosynthesis C-methylase UbiE
MQNQVDKTHYDFSRYCGLDRWSSYWYQLSEITRLKPERLLEVGVGDNVVSSYLKNNTKIDCLTLDIDGELEPDIVGSIENIPLEEDSFDAVCAFEVLEHLPFDSFELCLKELRRVSKSFVIISLPHWGRHFSIEIRLPYVKKIKLQFKLGIEKPAHVFNGEHYWEIGKKGYDIKLIREKMKAAGFEVVKDFIAFHSPYHHFFVLKK